jgi:hypothetical protein
MKEKDPFLSGGLRSLINEQFKLSTYGIYSRYGVLHGCHL